MANKIKLLFIGMMVISLPIYSQSAEDSLARREIAERRTQSGADRKVFLDCLSEFKNYKNSEIMGMIGVEPDELQSFARVNESVLDSLTLAQRRARFREFNLKFQRFQTIHEKLQKKSIEFKNKLAAMPLTTGNTARETMEIRARAHEDILKRARMKLVIQSLECNKSLVDFVAQTQKGALLLSSTTPPVTVSEIKVKKFGKFGGSRRERLLQGYEEKLNLTPVDPEFYQTQLGKKLEKDLGGRVDYWSYDYQHDELYVQVGAEVAKIGVIEIPGGSRIIKTKVGPRFEMPKAPDEKVGFSAEGRFLTGDKNQETLFGKMPSSKPALMEEPRGGDTGHDSSHNHD